MRQAVIAGAGAVVALIAPLNASAAEWWYVARSSTTTDFVDKTSVETIIVNGKSQIKALSHFFSSKADVDGTKSAQNIWYFDCENKQSALKSTIRYREDGSVAASVTISDAALSWSAPAPGAVSQSLVVFACNATSIASGNTFTAEGQTFVRVGDIAAAAAFNQKAPSPAIAPAKVMPVVPGAVTVQFGAFASAALAHNEWDELAAAFPTDMARKGERVEPLLKDGKTLFRARVTGFASIAEAQAFCTKLKAAGRACFLAF